MYSIKCLHGGMYIMIYVCADSDDTSDTDVTAF